MKRQVPQVCLFVARSFLPKCLQWPQREEWDTLIPGQEQQCLKLSCVDTARDVMAARMLVRGVQSVSQERNQRVSLHSMMENLLLSTLTAANSGLLLLVDRNPHSMSSYHPLLSPAWGALCFMSPNKYQRAKGQGPDQQRSEASRILRNIW